MKHGFAARSFLGDPGIPPQTFYNITPVLNDLLYNQTYVDELRCVVVCTVMYGAEV